MTRKQALDKAKVDVEVRLASFVTKCDDALKVDDSLHAVISYVQYLEERIAGLEEKLQHREA